MTPATTDVDRTTSESWHRQGPEQLGDILDRVVAGWRIPTDVEQREDYYHLSRFLEPRLAATIASMPCVITDPEAAAPLSLRIDAWLWRSARLLGTDR